MKREPLEGVQVAGACVGSEARLDDDVERSQGMAWVIEQATENRPSVGEWKVGEDGEGLAREPQWLEVPA